MVDEQLTGFSIELKFNMVRSYFVTISKHKCKLTNHFTLLK